MRNTISQYEKEKKNDENSPYKLFYKLKSPKGTIKENKVHKESTSVTCFNSNYHCANTYTRHIIKVRDSKMTKLPIH